MTHKIEGATITSSTLGHYAIREDEYLVQAKCTSGDFACYKEEVHHFVTISDAYLKMNGGIPASDASKLLNWLQDRHFDYLPFRARQLGTQIVFDAPFKIILSPTTTPNCVRLASNGYKLVLNPARNTGRALNTKFTVKHSTDFLCQKWQFSADLHANKRNQVFLNSLLMCELGESVDAYVHLWVGNTNDRKEWLKTLNDMG